MVTANPDRRRVAMVVIRNVDVAPPSASRGKIRTSRATRESSRTAASWNASPSCSGTGRGSASKGRDRTTDWKKAAPVTRRRCIDLQIFPCHSRRETVPSPPFARGAVLRPTRSRSRRTRFDCAASEPVCLLPSRQFADGLAQTQMRRAGRTTRHSSLAVSQQR